MPTPTHRARLLRQNQTEAEKLLWSRLRARQLCDAKFVRQCPVGPYIVDFACRPLRLAVELDGGQHADNPQDAERTRLIENDGWRLVRFWNHDVMGNVEGVLANLSREVEIARGG